MAKTGQIYTYDTSQNVTFPAAITSGIVNSYNILPRGNNKYNLGSDSSKWANIYATIIHENGKTLASKYAGISHTHNYAGSNSVGGPANRVKNALTFGSKTYNGSSAQTITLADLGGQAAGNYAILGSNGKLDESVIPAVAITDTYIVANKTAMLALNAQKGDIAIRSDLNKSFVLQATPASTAAN